MRGIACLFVLSAGAAGGLGAAPEKRLSTPKPAPGKPAQKSPSAVARLPIVEASVFKDGHVLVRQEGEAVPDAQGGITLEHLPIPVEGSYLPYVKTPGVEIAGVVATPAKVDSRRDAATLAELLRANPGARVRVVEMGGARYEGIFLKLLVSLGWPIPRDETAEATIETLPPSHMLLKSGDGQRTVPLSQVSALTLIGPITRQIVGSDSRVRLRLLLDKPATRVTVGAEYLQKGLRWIPSYRMDLDGQGMARTQFRATVINELADLENTRTRFVIGVPRIFNEERTDALALQQKPKPLSDRFERDVPGNFGGFGGFGGGGFGGAGGGGGRFCGEDDGCGQGAGNPGEHEDLFYLEPRRLTLKKGETLQLPLGQFNIAYQDVYTADIPFFAEVDAERARGLTDQQRQELAAELLAVRAKHQLRLTNNTGQPLTTGPTAVFREGRLAAHSLVLFTPPGSSTLCRLGDAPELEVTHNDQETGRDPAIPHPHDFTRRYYKISMQGKVTLTNRASRSLPVELTRNVPGNVDTAADGEITMLDDPHNPARRVRSGQPWTNHRTGSTRILWKVTMKPGEVREFPYTWHVFQE